MSVMLLEEVHPSLTFYFSVKSLTAAGKFKNRRYRENNQKKTVSPISETLLNTSYDCGHYLRAARSHYFYCHCSWLSPPSLPGLTAHRQRRTFYTIIDIKYCSKLLSNDYLPYWHWRLCCQALDRIINMEKHKSAANDAPVVTEMVYMIKRVMVTLH